MDLAKVGRENEGPFAEEVERNIFLHFLNRDARDIYGTTSSLHPEAEKERLHQAIRVAVLLCREYCVIPPTFILEDRTIADLFLESEAYFRFDLLRSSMRESDPEEFIDKKKREYRSHPERYAGYYRSDASDTLKQISATRVPRRIKVGLEIHDHWKNDLEDYANSSVWGEVLTRKGQKGLSRQLRRMPDIIIEKDQGIIWPVINDMLGEIDVGTKKKCRENLQHYYFSSYIASQGYAILAEVPFACVDFKLNQPYPVLFSYRAFSNTLGMIHAKEAILNLEPLDIISLKESLEYILFKEQYVKLAVSAASSSALLRTMASRLNGCQAIPSFRARQEAHPTIDFPALLGHLALVAAHLEKSAQLESSGANHSPLLVSAGPYRLSTHSAAQSEPLSSETTSGGSSVAHQASTIMDTSAASSTRTILVVATEWSSHNGGLSTFNREMCLALARARQKVYCYVLAATETEIADARGLGVEVIVAPNTPGLDPRHRLLSRPSLPTGIRPDVIVGHDRITGPIAKLLTEDHFPEAKKALFIHTTPSEIEWFKSHLTGPGAASVAEEREQVQHDLASKADIVLAVGPRLHRDIVTMLGRHAKSPLAIYPGIGEFADQGSPLPNIQVLLLGRASDEELKGLDLAARSMGLVVADNPSLFPVEPLLLIRGADPGTGDDLKRRLETVASSPRLRIRVKEYKADIERITLDIERASLLLMPSREEGFGLVGTEALAQGTPILVSSRSGLGESIKLLAPSLASAFVVDVTSNIDVDAPIWRDAIRFSLMDRVASFRRTAELRERLKDHLSWDKVAAEIVEAINRS